MSDEQEKMNEVPEVNSSSSSEKTAGPEKNIPGAEAPGAEVPGTEAPGAETSEAEAPGAEVSEAEAPKVEAPGAETSEAEAPKVEAPKAEAPGAETPGAETPEAEASGAESQPSADVTENTVNQTESVDASAVSTGQPEQPANTVTDSSSEHPEQSANTVTDSSSEQPKQSENTVKAGSSEHPEQPAKTVTDSSSEQTKQSGNTVKAVSSGQPKPRYTDSQPSGHWQTYHSSPVPGDDGGTPGSPRIPKHTFRDGFVTGMITMMVLCFLVIGGAWLVRNYDGELPGSSGGGASAQTEAETQAVGDDSSQGEGGTAGDETAAGSGASGESSASDNESGTTAAETESSDTLSGGESEFCANLQNKLAEIDKIIDENYIFNVDADTVYDSTIKGYISGLDDPYSEYYTQEEYAETMNDSSGSYVGIGVAVQQDVDTGAIRALTVYEGSPAAQAGMKSGDIITAVDGTDVTTYDIDKVVEMIRGEAGTEVTITVYRDGEYLDLTMKRAQVDKVTVSSKMLDSTTGYIQLTEFDSVSADQLRDAVDELRQQGMKSFVLDLRDDPGGLLTSVTDIADLFLPKGDNILYMMDKKGNRTDYNCEDSQYIDEPVVVLVNGNTASAAEVLSGALRDNGRAQIVGTQTFGKGIVQTFFPLSDGSAVKLTTAHYFTPSGTDIHGVGITPDKEVEEDATTEADEQLEAAQELLKSTSDSETESGN